jgi:hypothetical protein
VGATAVAAAADAELKAALLAEIDSFLPGLQEAADKSSNV